MLDVVTRPPCSESLAGKAEFADELDEFAIGWLRSEHGSQERDDPGRKAVPVTVEHTHFGLEKRCAQDVFARGERYDSARAMRLDASIPMFLLTTKCRGKWPAVDESLHSRVKPFRNRASTPTRRRSRQRAQVIAGVLVELQGAGKAVKDLVGGLMVSSLLESQVVLGTDAGKHGDFLATQSLDASALAVRQADVGRLEQFAAGPQKSRQPAGCFH
jgi:hypothetical protein